MKERYYPITDTGYNLAHLFTMIKWIITFNDGRDIRGRAKPRWQGAQKRAEMEQITAAHGRP